MTIIKEHKIKAINEVHEYCNDKPIQFIKASIPKNHLYCIRGIYCDFVEYQNFIEVYLHK